MTAPSARNILIPIPVATACLVMSACGGDPVGPRAAPLQPAYLLSAIDGAALPCCSYATTDGQTAEWASSELNFIGTDDYVWKLDLSVRVQTGAQAFNTVIVARIVASGHYARDGSSLLFADSATARRFAARVVNDTIVAIYNHSTYRFAPVPPISLYGSLWAELSCSDGTSKSTGCAVTDDSGVVTTTIGGGLQFDYNVPDGHYAWETLLEHRPLRGATDTVFVSSTGTYAWDGTTLTLRDGSTGRLATGHLTKPLDMLVQAGPDVVAFHRFVSPPAPPDRFPHSH